ncbi:MAG: HDOD domain-containing protein [Gammaproteobacteria bacterium]|nr:HDOD domain-containing protein [Gammaproteobacteria bacterium]MDH5660298.1 HDOD domain-containing protein [Gammaproteobacteria bacterium]
MPASEVQDLVNNASNLVSLPEVSIRVNELANNPDSTADDMGKVISQDPALVARMLKIANSAFYGVSNEVDTISRAIAILGINKIRDLVISTAASDTFDGIPNDLITMQDFWHHSLYCGLLAQILAKKSKKIKSESIFIAGLLHDIGQLLMFNQLPEKSHETILLLMEGSEELETYEAERHIFGFDHMQVGAALIKKWKLASVLEECVEFHHEPQNAKNFPVEVALINIANAVAVMADFDSMSEDDEIPMINPLSWKLTGLSKDDLPDAIKKAQEEIKEIEAVLFPSK